MSNLLGFTVVIAFFLKNPLCHFKPPGACYKGLLYFKISGRPRPGQDVYFWKFDMFGSDDDTTTTRKQPAGQPPLPGTKYLVRISPHFDNRSDGRSSRGISSPGGGLARFRCFHVVVVVVPSSSQKSSTDQKCQTNTKSISLPGPDVQGS